MMTKAKPWFWRVRGSKYMPAGWAGSAVLLSCLAAIVGGISIAGLKALSGQWPSVPIGLGLAAIGLATLSWACANRSLKHPRSRWRD